MKLVVKNPQVYIQRLLQEYIQEKLDELEGVEITVVNEDSGLGRNHIKLLQFLLDSHERNLTEGSQFTMPSGYHQRLLREIKDWVKATQS